MPNNLSPLPLEILNSIIKRTSNKNASSFASTSKKYKTITQSELNRRKKIKNNAARIIQRYYLRQKIHEVLIEGMLFLDALRGWPTNINAILNETISDFHFLTKRQRTLVKKEILDIFMYNSPNRTIQQRINYIMNTSEENGTRNYRALVQRYNSLHCRN